ncbi:putative multicopperoxidase [Lindgomyces ingoldianus]|uniref:Multicopperoxidase n=1 Tax=Lindgomyces ingoldianus TaxID=673940 RepID=A0ACB6QDX3_9PLEO|nr:putative multicopperoxidase [Lindgomyces ingoldianus]KAF2465184.1 putative multicopperoxidase [Lindgomyces ingoldianus]
MTLALLLLPLLASIPSSIAKVVTYNWDISWVHAAPDGFDRPVIGINGKWPLPKVEANVGDTIVVHATNSLGNETTGIHWHGQFQTGSVNMDGPVGVTQCGIPPGSSFTYSFQANPAGSYWYHSHASGQYPDGLRGPMIIHDKAWEATLKIEDQYVMTVSDWYHDQMPGMVHYYLSAQNTIDHGGAEPIPNATLINDKQTETFKIKPGKKYLIRIISMTALAAHYVQFDGHKMEVVAIDGVPVKSTPTDVILVSSAQRYDVIITGLRNPKKNYAFVSQFDPDMFDFVPEGLVMANDGILEYDPAFGKPTPLRKDSFPGFLDDFTLVPLDGQPLLGNPTQTVTMNVNFTDFSVGARAGLGKTPYIGQKVPTLFTALTTGQNAKNPKVYGETTNPYVLNKGDIVQIVLNNLDDGGHPFHLHGHNFQVLARTTTQPWDGNTATFPKVPMRRDTVKAYASGALVLRFKADNPGVFLFHCHIDWHVESGLTVTFIEAPCDLQKQFPNGIPHQQKAICQKQGIPTEGNCAGNTRNPLDTSKCVQPEQFDPNPYGALINPPKGRRMRDFAREVAAAQASP